jgi:hypothetical protein
MTRHIVTVLALLGCCAPALAQKTQNLFHVERSKNRNIVHHEHARTA